EAVNVFFVAGVDMFLSRTVADFATLPGGLASGRPRVLRLAVQRRVNALALGFVTGDAGLFADEVVGLRWIGWRRRRGVGRRGRGRAVRRERPGWLQRLRAAAGASHADRCTPDAREPGHQRPRRKTVTARVHERRAPE